MLTNQVRLLGGQDALRGGFGGFGVCFSFFVLGFGVNGIAMHDGICDYEHKKESA